MLVYGDPEFDSDWTTLRTRLEQSLRQANPGSIDDLRSLLIQTGQFEQAVADACACNPVLNTAVNDCMALTDTAAKAFYTLWTGAEPREECSFGTQKYAAQLERLSRENCPMHVKVPEGFAFYALYPEQYALAALDWERLHKDIPDKRVLVVGIRSIGTTLSALVSVALENSGWRPLRLTVRPIGRPWSREVHLPKELPRMPAALIVDEGPGLSGSSFQAVAHALEAAGFGRDKISFLPGHDAGPGSAVSPDAITSWDASPKFFVPLANVRWRGLSLAQTLCAMSSRCRTIDLSNGAWRQRTFAHHSHWPPSNGPFERMKLLGNCRKPVLWKFAGLGCWHDASRNSMQTASARLHARAQAGWALEPCGFASGFVGMPWVEGRPLAARDFNRIGVEHLGRYITVVSEPALDSASHYRAIDRLCNIVQANAIELLGEEFASAVARCCEYADIIPLLSCYGDGDVAPYNWIETAPGNLIKTGALCRNADHTIIGPQSILWDVASAAIEWNLSAENTRKLADVTGNPDDEVLIFYLVAYTAFRAGQISICLNWTSDPHERGRLRNALRHYRNRLITLLR